MQCTKEEKLNMGHRFISLISGIRQPIIFNTYFKVLCPIILTIALVLYKISNPIFFDTIIFSSLFLSTANPVLTQKSIYYSVYHSHVKMPFF